MNRSDIRPNQVLLFLDENGEPTGERGQAIPKDSRYELEKAYSEFVVNVLLLPEKTTRDTWPVNRVKGAI